MRYKKHLFERQKMKRNRKKILLNRRLILIILILLFPIITGWKKQNLPNSNPTASIPIRAQYVNISSLFSDTPDKHYEIYTINDFLRFATSVNNGFDYHEYTITLENDLDFSGITPIIIGNVWNPFSGEFNGKNHLIKNYNLSSEEEYVGIFGYTIEADIKNLIVENASIYGIDSYGTGGIVGCAFRGSINNCTFSGQVCSTVGSVGGIAGSSRASLSECTVSGKISDGCGGSSYFPDGIKIIFGTGGIVGDNEDTLYKCINNANVYPKGGGIAGCNQGIIASCVNYGNAYGGISVSTTSSSWMNYAFNLGNCTAGITDFADPGCRIEHCHNLANASGRYKAGLVSFFGNENDPPAGAITNCIYNDNGGVKAVCYNYCHGTIENCRPINITNKLLDQVKVLLSNGQFIETEQYLINAIEERKEEHSMIFFVIIIIAIITVLFVTKAKKHIIIHKAKMCAAKKEYLMAVETLCTLRASSSIDQLAKIYLNKHLENSIYTRLIIFGKYKNERGIAWDLYEITDDSLVLISRKTFPSEPINGTVKNIKWEESDLYHKLNNYYKTVWFNRYESKFIEDAITILTLEDAHKYFPSRNKRKCKCLDIKKSGLCMNGNSAWWLRPNSPACVSKYPFVSFDGLISTQGMNIDSDIITIRPVVKLRRSL